MPPTPYTIAVASEATRVSAVKKTRPYIAGDRRRCRARAAARPANIADSSSGRPYSLASIAPATLNRSVISEPISASSCICSRLIVCSRRPTHLAGKMKIGSRTSAMSVTCQESTSIVIRTRIRLITFETTEDRVVVRARWAPMTSLLSRLTSEPVWARMKNATGIRCTWSKTWVRRS